ncbi:MULTISPECIES: hypothetical protein [unclassified Streptomyces]|uniref:hypothetical protein n=1 Tax=unclassified Streptomyces TaxID=2593676 RepID=UPI0033AEB69F
MTFDPRTWNSGETVTAALLNEQVRDQFASMFAAWTSFTPIWTGTTTNPVYGNAVVTCRYMKIGRSCRVRWDILMGSQTTYGSGGWWLGLPFAAAGTGAQIGSVHAFQSQRVSGQIIVSAGASVGSIFFPTTGSPATLTWAGPTVPLTWAAGGRLVAEMHYETAT